MVLGCVFLKLQKCCKNISKMFIDNIFDFQFLILQFHVHL